MYFQRQRRFGQRLMDGSKEVIQKLLDYLVWLQTPNESFGGVPICPFIKGDFESDRIKFSVYSQRHDKTLTEHITEYVESGKSTGIIVQLDPVRTTRKRYQRFVNKLMKEKGFEDYKSLVLDPLEDWSLAGVETRKMAPCVLINIGTRKDFAKAAKYMKKTKYYEGFLLEDFKRLKPKTYKKRVKELNG